MYPVRPFGWQFYLYTAAHFIKKSYIKKCPLYGKTTYNSRDIHIPESINNINIRIYTSIWKCCYCHGVMFCSFSCASLKITSCPVIHSWPISFCSLFIFPLVQSFIHSITLLEGSKSEHQHCGLLTDRGNRIHYFWFTFSFIFICPSYIIYVPIFI